MSHGPFVFQVPETDFTQWLPGLVMRLDEVEMDSPDCPSLNAICLPGILPNLPPGRVSAAVGLPLSAPERRLSFATVE